MLRRNFLGGLGTLIAFPWRLLRPRKRVSARELFHGDVVRDATVDLTGAQLLSGVTFDGCDFERAANDVPLELAHCTFRRIRGAVPVIGSDDFIHHCFFDCRDSVGPAVTMTPEAAATMIQVVHPSQA